MSTTLIKEERTADDLVRVLSLINNAQLLAMVREYFFSFCDCDIRTWLIARITQELTEEDPVVVDMIKELIINSTPVETVPPIAAAARPDGFLVSAACVGADRVGTFADGLGATFTQTLVASDSSCGLVDSLIEDSLLDQDNDWLREHTPETGLGYTTQDTEFPNNTGPGSGLRTVFDNLWKFDANGRLKMGFSTDPLLVRPAQDDLGYSDEHIPQTVLANDTPIRTTSVETGITINAGYRPSGGLIDWAGATWVTLGLEIMGVDLPNFRQGGDNRALYVTLVVRPLLTSTNQKPSMLLFIHGKNGLPAEQITIVDWASAQDEYTYRWNDEATPEQLALLDETGVEGDINSGGDVPVFFCMKRSADQLDGRKIDFKLTTADNQLSVSINGINIWTAPYAFEGNEVPTEGFFAGFGFEPIANYPQPEQRILNTWVSDYYVRNGGDVEANWRIGLMDVDLLELYHQDVGPEYLVPESFYNPLTKDLNMSTGYGVNPGDGQGKYLPFMIAGFPTVDGVRDKDNVTFEWYDVSARYVDGVREGQLLTTRVPCAPYGDIDYNPVTGIGVIEWTSGPADLVMPRWPMLAVLYKGQELYTIQMWSHGPTQPNQQIPIQSVGAQTTGNVLLRYPYEQFYMNYP